MLTGCSCFIQTLLIVSVANSSRISFFFHVDNASVLSPLVFFSPSPPLVSLSLLVSLWLFASVCLTSLVSIICAWGEALKTQRSKSGCQQVISCRRHRTLSMCVCVCVCVFVCVRATNDLQIPWSCCGPGSVSVPLIGKHESGLYSTAAEMSASVRACVCVWLWTHMHTQISSYHHTKWKRDSCTISNSSVNYACYI